MNGEGGRWTPCLGCGELVEISLTPVGGQTPEARCRPCAADHGNPRRNRERERSYNTAAWRTLSRRLRREACCSVCGTRDDLTVDHLPGAWERAARGLPLRPGVDVDVKCRAHNASAGPARGPYAHLRRPS